jgi:DNA (cytosine-5)-methyltransferase 1
MSSAPTVLSLFSGAGGLDLGFLQAGLRVVWAIDLNADACATYRRNIGQHVVCGSVKEIDSASLPRCDVVIGGPPCQGYSVAGHRDPADPRSSLTWDFVRIVRATKPRAFVMENVKALAVLARWASVRRRLLADLSASGYDVVLHVLNARDFGVPQGRERAFFVGTTGRKAVAQIVPTCMQPLTAGDVLRCLPRPGVAPNLGVCRARVVPARVPVLRRSPYAGMLFNGQGRPIDLSSTVNTLPASMGGNRTPIVDEGELRDGPPSWVADYHRRLLAGEPPLQEAPARLRRLTVTEAALLQTFPADFVFSGRQSSQYAQIGNAVPPLLAQAVAATLLRALNGQGEQRQPGQALLFA